MSQAEDDCLNDRSAQCSLRQRSELSLKITPTDNFLTNAGSERQEEENDNLRMSPGNYAAQAWIRNGDQGKKRPQYDGRSDEEYKRNTQVVQSAHECGFSADKISEAEAPKAYAVPDEPHDQPFDEHRHQIPRDVTAKRANVSDSPRRGAQQGKAKQQRNDDRRVPSGCDQLWRNLMRCWKFVVHGDFSKDT